MTHSILLFYFFPSLIFYHITLLSFSISIHPVPIIYCFRMFSLVSVSLFSFQEYQQAFQSPRMLLTSPISNFNSPNHLFYLSPYCFPFLYTPLNNPFEFSHMVMQLSFSTTTFISSSIPFLTCAITVLAFLTTNNSKILTAVYVPLLFFSSHPSLTKAIPIPSPCTIVRILKYVLGYS